MTTLTYTGTLVVCECPVCGVRHAIPEGLRQHARERGDPEGRVFCPLGHTWVYTKTLEQQLAEARNDAQYFKQARDAARLQRDQMERSRAAYKGELTKVRRTIHAGKCPWCRRSFKRLEAHMAAKHPDVDPEAEPS
jgi:hypothetical protein